MVARVVANFPDAVIGFEPAPLHCFDHGAHQFPVAVAQRIGITGLFACIRQFDDELDDRAEHVQLNLLIRGVSDADRPGAGVSGE